MKSLSDTLIDQVIEHEARETLKKDEQADLDALSESLAETTSLTTNQISAVIGNLQQQASDKNKLFNFNFPSLSAQSLRIIVYLVLGLLGYSVYTAAKIDGWEEPEHYLSSQNRTLDLYTSVTNVSEMLESHYESFYNNHNRLPLNMKQLNSTFQTAGFLDSFAFIESYAMLENGTIKFELTDIYQANKWLELRPTVETNPIGADIKFDCHSNASSAFLQFTGAGWCKKKW